MNEHTHNHEHGNNEAAAASATPVTHDAVGALASLKNIQPAHFLNKEMVFRFRKDSTTGTKRPNLTMIIPVPSLDGLATAIAENEKVQEYVLDLVYNAIQDAAREQIADETNPVTEQDKLDLSKLTIDYLASIPTTDRRGGGIPKETWEEFAKDYMETMQVALPSRTPEQIGNAAKIFVARFSPVKDKKPMIIKLMEYLNLWFDNSKKNEEFSDVYEFLGKKSKDLLAIDPDAWKNNI